MNKADCSHYPNKIVEGPRTNDCEECDQAVSLRYCLTCGHVGCCDSSPGRHAREHALKTGHQVMSSLGTKDTAFQWCYIDDDYLE